MTYLDKLTTCIELCGFQATTTNVLYKLRLISESDRKLFFTKMQDIYGKRLNKNLTKSDLIFLNELFNIINDNLQLILSYDEFKKCKNRTTAILDFINFKNNR